MSLLPLSSVRSGERLHLPSERQRARSVRGKLAIRVTARSRVRTELMVRVVARVRIRSRARGKARLRVRVRVKIRGSRVVNARIMARTALRQGQGLCSSVCADPVH